MTFDAYPYEWASTRLLITLPTWVQAGGPAPTKERLADRAVRDRIRDELTERGVLYAGAGGLADIRLGYFGSPANLALRRPDARAMCARDAAAISSTCCATCCWPRACGSTRSRPARTPTASAASTSTPSRWSGRTRRSSARSRARAPTAPTRGSSASSCATRRCCRLEERGREDDLDAGGRLGLKDRGRIADGLVADLVVFDPATVRSNATYDEPRRFPDGIEHVLVNGTLVVEDGRHTGATPGPRAPPRPRLTSSTAGQPHRGRTCPTAA